MPIEFTPKQGWHYTEGTKEEFDALIRIGKNVIVEGIATAYTNDRYKQWLLSLDKEQFFQA